VGKSPEPWYGEPKVIRSVGCFGPLAGLALMMVSTRLGPAGNPYLYCGVAVTLASVPFMAVALSLGDLKTPDERVRWLRFFAVSIVLICVAVQATERIFEPVPEYVKYGMYPVLAIAAWFLSEAAGRQSQR